MNSLVSEIGNLHFQGNIVDSSWFQNLRHENGKANLNAIIILSEIIYWYKPIEVRDEANGELIGYKKKFKANKLQKSYQSFADSFGLTKGQAKLACKFLKDRGLINIEFRNITTESGQALANVMFIEPVIEEIKKISCKKELVEDSNSNKPTKGKVTEVCNLNKPTIGKSTRISNFNKPTMGINSKVCNSIDSLNDDINTQVCDSIATPTENIDAHVCSSTCTGVEIEQQTYTEITTKNTTEITTESKKNIYRSTAEKIIDFLNEKAGTSYIYSSRETRAIISARLNEGFKLHDFIKVINIKTTEWLGTEYEKYLRPQTLFGKYFEGYLNQKPNNRALRTCNNNPADTFSNRKQRRYDIEKIERQLLGWD